MCAWLLQVDLGRLHGQESRFFVKKGALFQLQLILASLKALENLLYAQYVDLLISRNYDILKVDEHKLPF